MTPTTRRVMLTAHVASSVAWLGAVISFFALSIVGMRSGDAGVVRACYVAMNLVGLFVIVPCSVLALLTGTFQALTTPWGLFRYYWCREVRADYRRDGAVAAPPIHRRREGGSAGVHGGGSAADGSSRDPARVRFRIRDARAAGDDHTLGVQAVGEDSGG